MISRVWIIGVLLLLLLSTAEYSSRTIQVLDNCVDADMSKAVSYIVVGSVPVNSESPHVGVAPWVIEALSELPEGEINVAVRSGFVFETARFYSVGPLRESRTVFCKFQDESLPYGEVVHDAIKPWSPNLE